MKRMKQINESKMMIFEAFMRLLKSYDFDEITISQITQEAGVARMTLYRHFSEKEDIILFAFEQSFNKVMELMAGKEDPTIQDLLHFRFKALKESPYTEILAKNNRLDKLFQSVGKKYSHHFGGVLPDMKDQFVGAFIGGGVDAMTELWIREGMIESPEAMVNRIMTLLMTLNKESRMS